MRIVLLSMLVLCWPIKATSQDLAKHFAGIQGTFVLLDGQTGKYVRHNPDRAARQFAPCSTFKIPNTAILLETGAASGPDHLVKYDPALKQEGVWARDHTLQSAFRVSALWYYLVMAREAGLAAEQRFLEQFAYGNEDASGGLTGPPFWVDGSLRISADEQVAFLERFHEGQLGLSERTTRLTKDIMVAETTPRWRLSAKTGACQPKGEDATMWYVGYVERGESVYYFALQLGDKTFGDLFSQRVTKARAILSELGILD